METDQMRKLDEFIAIVKKVNANPPVYSEEYWADQNREISEIHKEFVARAESERVDSELLNKQFTI